jgi:hypothetical protein
MYEVNLNQLHLALKFCGKTRFKIWREISNSKSLKLIFRGGSVNRTCKYIFRGSCIAITILEKNIFNGGCSAAIVTENLFTG